MMRPRLVCPIEPCVNFPGEALARSMKLPSVVAGTSLRSTKTAGSIVTCVIGVKSAIGS